MTLRIPLYNSDARNALAVAVAAVAIGVILTQSGVATAADPTVAAGKPAQWRLTMRAPLRIGPVSANATTVPRGGRLELTFDLDATYDNPFDPAQVDVICRLRGPGDEDIAIPGFFFTPFSRETDGAVGGRGRPVWKVRLRSSSAC